MGEYFTFPGDAHIQVKLTPGYVGQSGYSGASGFSGHSGYSGYSGLSGAAGYGFIFIPNVKDYIDPSSMPVSPTIGERYLSSGTGSGWTKNYVYTWNGTGWDEYIPIPNNAVIVESTLKIYAYDGSLWGNFTEKGDSGFSGYSGQSGASGYSGDSGQSGYSGQQGDAGPQGLSGYSGYSGFSGEQGSQGLSGYSGWSGVSGISGWSGWSGYSGAAEQHWNRVGSTLVTAIPGDTVAVRVLELEKNTSDPVLPTQGNLKLFVKVTGSSPTEVTQVGYTDYSGEKVIVATKIE